MMKLAFCLFNYFPYGGLQRDFLRIARLCVARGHEVHVYTMAWKGPVEPGFHLHVIPANGWQNHTRAASFAALAHKAIQSESVDLVIGFNKMPFLDIYYAADVCYQARLNDRPRWWHHLLPRYRQGLAFERAVFAHGKGTQILLISPFQQAAFTQCYQTEAERFHLLPPGISRDRIAPANAEQIRTGVRGAMQLTEHHCLLLMIGSGFRTKGVDRAIRALASLPASTRDRIQLTIIGQDEPAPFLALARTLQVSDQVIFLGGRSNVLDYLLAADLLLHPSYHENTGTALLEAVVAGLPVLTLDHCGYAPYITAADCGKVLPSPFNQDAFNAALAQMIASPDRNQWKKNGLTFAKHADIYSLPEKAVDFIEQARPATFDKLMSLQGERYRQLEGRLTQQVVLGGKPYFIKQHRGVGWKEIFKNLLQGRWPVLSAKNEWQALTTLQTIGLSVPTVTAYGERGWNPARRQSYILMEALTPTISLETLCQRWQEAPPAFSYKLQLLNEVTRIAKNMHAAGVNHRDFYLCHFLLDTSCAASGKLSLIDLHRAQQRRVTPTRWVIKDLAGLYFSSKDSGLTQRDYLRFIKQYSGQPLRYALTQQQTFWEKVKERGEQLYREHSK